MISFSRQQHIFGQAIIIAIIIANNLFLKSEHFGILLGVFFLWFNSRKLADIIAPNIHQGFKNLVGLLTIMAYVSLIYTLAYHIYQINWWVFLFVLISIALATETLSYFYHTQHYFFNKIKFKVLNLSTIRHNIIPLIVIALDVLLLIGLSQNASYGIIRSPWELLTYKFWAVFILSNLFLLITILDNKSQKNIILIAYHFLMLSSIAVILYPLGFGYDSFIHGETIRTISETGTIKPRLLLYIGQYGLSFFINNLSSLDVLIVNRWLMPILFSLIWPASVFYGLRYGFNWSFKTSYLACFWSLFIGFNFAIMTTPQNLAYLFLAMIIFMLPIIIKGSIGLYFIWLIGFMTLTIHPIGGIPLLFLGSLLSISKIKKFPNFKKVLYFINIALASISLPLFFAIYQKLNGLAWSQILTVNSLSAKLLPKIKWHNTFDFPLDMAHNLGENFLYFYILIIILALIFIYKNNKYIFFKKLFTFILIIIANYIISALFLSFNLQINYQKDDYTNRIAYILAISFLPIFLTGLYFFWQKTIKSKNYFFGKGLLIICSLIIISISTYFSYPIYDKHKNSKSFNVSLSDIKTVELIENDASGEDYIVLANQMLGAASIYSFGFAHYYNNNFYYSMPLDGDNIYQNYLSMIESDASREEALKALDKAGVNKLYFVVNNYWHSAKSAIRQADNSANRKILIDNGVNTIFVYDR